LGHAAVALLAVVAVLTFGGDRARADDLVVSDVLIQGNQLVPAAQIWNMLKVRPGRQLVPAEVQEDVRTLYASQQFATVWAQQAPDGPGKVKVYFIVREHHQTVRSVIYQGARHLRKEELDQVTGLRVGVPLNPLANKAACAKIVAKYHEEGRPFASCVLVKGGEAGDRDVIFNISEGPKVKVRGLGFTGNTFVSAAVLRTHVNTSTGLFNLGIVGGPYNPAMIETDVSELVKYYRALGFLDVRVARELRYSPDGQDVTIHFHIREGPRYLLLSAPRVRGTRAVPPEQLEALAEVKAGEYYDQRKIDRDLKVIRDYLGYTGRDVRVQVVPVYAQGAPGVINALLYEVAPAQPQSTSARGQAP
jgi:outer membrane protein insertion porin family